MTEFQKLLVVSIPKTLDEFIEKYGVSWLYKSPELVEKFASANLMSASVLNKIIENFETDKQFNEFVNTPQMLKCCVEQQCIEPLIEAFYKFELNSSLTQSFVSAVPIRKFVDETKSLKKNLVSAKNFEVLCLYFNADTATQDDLKYVLSKIDIEDELVYLSQCEELLKRFAEYNVFQEVIDTYANTKDWRGVPYLCRLLPNKNLLEVLAENREDIRYLLNRIDRSSDLDHLCEKNTPLIKHILNDFILDKETIDRFNRLLEEDEWCEGENIHTIFDLIEFYATHSENGDESGCTWYEKLHEKYIDQEFLKLSELNRKVYLLNNFDLTKDQKLELIEILKDNEIAKNTLIQIVENHLEDTYDFETLKELLTKDNEKKKIKLNF